MSFSFDQTNTVGALADQNMSFLVKKTERLVAAVYLITEHIGQEEPIRKKLREQSLSLLDSVTAFQLKNLENLIWSLTAALEVAVLVHYVSPGNASIVSGEAWSTFRFCKDSAFSGAGDLAPSFMHVALPKPKKTKPPTYKGHFYETSMGLSGISSSSPSAVSPIKLPKYRPSISDENAGKLSETTRSSKILELVSGREEVAVKDLKKTIVGVSDKTLQRDLAALVASGVLKKVGDRRWSRYSLAKDERALPPVL